jgi:hypothetical protein
MTCSASNMLGPWTNSTLPLAETVLLIVSRVTLSAVKMTFLSVLSEPATRGAAARPVNVCPLAMDGVANVKAAIPNVARRVDAMDVRRCGMNQISL